MKKFKPVIIFLCFFILLAVLNGRRGSCGWNDSSRLATIESLVERHTLAIDGTSSFNTGDKVSYNGRFYSDKQPVLQIYGAGIYYLVNKCFGITFEKNEILAAYLVTLFSLGLLSAAAIVFLYKIFLVLGAEEAWAAFLTLVAGAGTLFFSYSTVFNNHAPAGALIITGFYCLLRAKNTGKHLFLGLSGLFFSLAGSIDLACFIFIPLSVLVFAGNRDPKGFLFFVFGALPFILAYGGLNYHISGSLVPIQMNAAGFDYPGSAFNTNNLTGLVSKTFVDHVKYFFHMTFWYRGFILHTPIVLFALYGAVKMFRSADIKFKPEMIYATITGWLFVLVYLVKTNNYGGTSYSVRWFAAVLPLLCVPVVYLYDRVMAPGKTRILFAATCLFSMMSALVGTYEPFQWGADAFNRFYPSFLVAAWRVVRAPHSYKAAYMFVAVVEVLFFYRLWTVLDVKENDGAS